jgi:hypothetical protein
MTTKTKAIRALNDELRQNFATGGIDLICEGAALGYLAWQVRQG